MITIRIYSLQEFAIRPTHRGNISHVPVALSCALNELFALPYKKST